MEPAKMKTHHGYFLGKPMSAVGTVRALCNMVYYSECPVEVRDSPGC